MTTLTIEIPNKVQKTLTDLIEQLGGKVVNNAPNEHKAEKRKKKNSVLDDLDEAVVFVKKHKAGKVKAKSIEQLLNEL